MIRHKLVGLALVAAVLSAAWALRENFSGVDDSYRLAEIDRGSLRSTINATGSLYTVLSVNVGSQVSGRIDRVDVDFNDPVFAGQPVARIEQLSFLANRDAARAALAVAHARVVTSEATVDGAARRLASARARQGVYDARRDRAAADVAQLQQTYERKLGLSERGALSRDEMEVIEADLAKARADLAGAESEAIVQAEDIGVAEAELRQAEGQLEEARAIIPQREADLNLAEVELERTVIRSPIDGIVIHRAIEPGQTVAASLEAPNLFIVAQDLEAMEVHTLIDEADIGRVAVGQRATFSVDAYPMRTFGGEIRQIRKSPQQNRSVIKYVTIIATENPDLALLPGMTALVSIAVVETEELLRVPKRAARFQPLDVTAPAAQSSAADLRTVWIPDGRRPEPVVIRVGRSDDNYFEVLDGDLAPGDAVIVDRAPDRE